MNRTVDTLIIPYARRRTLELVLSLSGYEADKDAYLEAKGILERAVAALDDGRDPAQGILLFYRVRTISFFGFYGNDIFCCCHIAHGRCLLAKLA